METLPSELLALIVAHLPKHSLPQARLISQAFDSLAFPLLFSHVPHWLDYRLSHRSIVALAEDLCYRPAVMWSPWATGPDGPVEDMWLRIVWKVLMKSTPPSASVLGGVSLTALNFAELSGREEMCENRLRTGQNRFLMCRKYTEEARANIFGKFDAWTEI